MRLFDSHCHLDAPAFDPDREEVIAQARVSGVQAMLIPGVTVASWETLITLCSQTPGCYPALGLHPMFLAQHKDGDVEQLMRAVQKHQPVAIGEIGLDHYDTRDADLRERQSSLFESQLAVAQEVSLPVILHVRKAHDAVIKSLKKFKLVGGIAHAFNGSLQQAGEYIDLGFKLGFGGTLTYPGSRRIHQLATEIDLKHMVLETDAPDMVVASHRGERNSPAYLGEVLTALARLRPESMSSIAAITYQNCLDILALEDLG